MAISIEDPAVTVQIIDDLTTGGVGKAASAETVKTLQLNKQDKIPPFNSNGMWGSDINQLYVYFLIVGNLDNANLDYTNLDNAYLSNANLNYASLNYASLNYTNLTYANLTNASLDNANLDNANLTNASLDNANLDNANLDNANLTYANLSNANLSNATGLDPDINVALSSVNKDPNGDGVTVWILTWTDSSAYQCDPSTGLFTLQ